MSKFGTEKCRFRNRKGNFALHAHSPYINSVPESYLTFLFGRMLFLFLYFGLLSFKIK